MVQHITHWLFHEQHVFTTNKVCTRERWQENRKVVDTVPAQIHYQEVLAILEDLGLERVHLWLRDNHDKITMEDWNVGRRIGQKFGHGDFFFDDVEFLYAKPRTPHGDEGHHKTGVTWVDKAVDAEVGGHRGLADGDNGAPKASRNGYQSATLRLRVHSRTHG